MIARLAIASLCVIALSSDASAAVRVCQQTVSSGEVIAGSEMQARRAAIAAWQSSVSTAYGEAFRAWRLAMSKAVKCLKVTRGVACVALGRPCTVKQVAPPGPHGGKRPEQPV